MALLQGSFGPFGPEVAKEYFPKSKRYLPKSSVISPKVNVISPKVNVKYFQGILEECEVFEICCWGVTVTGVSKASIPNRLRLRSVCVCVLKHGMLNRVI